MSVSDLFSLEGRVALVTGAKRGIGRAIALTFAEAGADIATCDVEIEGDEHLGRGSSQYDTRRRYG